MLSLYGMGRAAEAVEEARHFLTLLAEDQQHLADRFGTPAAPLQGMLSGLEVTRTADGDAILPGVSPAPRSASSRPWTPPPTAADRPGRGDGGGPDRCGPRRALRR